MNKKKKTYPITCYGKHLCLVPDFNMWLIFLFLVRPYVVLVLSFANRNDRMELINMMYTDRVLMSWGALAGVPAAFVVYAWMKREPDASDFVRNIWSRGRMLLAVSAVFNVGLAFAPMILRGAHKVSVHGWWQLVASVIVLALILKSDYIRDCFSEFPEKTESK